MVTNDRIECIESLANKYGFSTLYCLQMLARIMDYRSMRYAHLDTIFYELDAELAVESFERQLNKMYI